jgi:hypothetical protein
VTPTAEMGPSILGGWRGFTRSQNAKEEAWEQKIVSCGDRRLLPKEGELGGEGVRHGAHTKEEGGCRHRRLTVGRQAWVGVSGLEQGSRVLAQKKKRVGLTQKGIEISNFKFQTELD